MAKIGVLALQGSVIEHIKMLESCEGVQAVEVRCAKDFDTVDGMILPGGESTTIGKLLRDFEMLEPLQTKIGQGMPTWGTCAGMILLAKRIVEEENVHLGVMDIAVRRNAYGSQLDSFRTLAEIPAVSRAPIPLVFVRAPWVERIEDGVSVLARIDDRMIAVEQGHLLATSFHPELTADLAFHQYFANKVLKAIKGERVGA